MPAFTVQVESAIDDGMVTVHVAGTIADATSAGLFHPSCRHSLSAYLPGATKVPTHTADPAGDAARQRLRDLERRTRKQKLLAAAAIDPVAGKEHAAKARALQGQIRGHVEASKDLGLFRKPEREQPNLGFVPASTVRAELPRSALDKNADFRRGVETVEMLVIKQGLGLEHVIAYLETIPSSAEVLAVARRAKDPKRLVTTLRGMRTKREAVSSGQTQTSKTATTTTATDDLSKRTVIQLRALAKERGIKLGSKDRKADIVTKLSAGKVQLAVDGLDSMSSSSLLSLAREFEIAKASSMSREKLLAALRREGAMSPEVRKALQKPEPAVVKAQATGPVNRFGTDYKVRPMTRREVEERELKAAIATDDTNRVSSMASWEKSLREQLASTSPDSAMVAFYRRALEAAEQRPQKLRDELASLRASKDPKLDQPSLYEGNLFRSGTPSEAQTSAHLDQVVSAKLGDKARLSALKQLKHQAALSPRSVVRLESVSAPESAQEIDYYENNRSINAFFDPALRRMVLAPHRLDNLDEWTANKKQAFRSGWSTHSGAEDGLSSTVAHEYGHHIESLIFGKGFHSAVDDERGRPLLGAIGKAFGFKVDPMASNVERELKRVVEDNRPSLAGLVSQYGSKNMHEMLAEIWQEYSTMGAQARPHIREVGEVIHRLADEGALK